MWGMQNSMTFKILSVSFLPLAISSTIYSTFVISSVSVSLTRQHFMQACALRNKTEDECFLVAGLYVSIYSIQSTLQAFTGMKVE